MGMASGGQNANRLEVRVRGNAHQLLEKYKQLARDAHQAGDRVAAEYYLQHSDHYFRVLNDSRIRQEEMRTRRGVFDPYEDEAQGAEADEADGAADGGQDGDQDSERAETRERPRERFDRPRGGQQGNDRQGGDRQQDRRPRGEDRDGGERQWQDRRPERQRDERRDDRQDGARGQSRPAEREDRPRDERPARIAPAMAEQALSDGEAALVAFGGVPAREPVQIEAPLEAADGVGEAPKRRRGRPRKVVAEPVEG
jgi:hypothetical protein